MSRQAEQLADPRTILPTDDAGWRAAMSILPGYHPWRDVGASGVRFVPAEARKAIEFIQEMLTHAEGILAGTPFLLERWQQAIVGNLFGWVRPDGTRRYREGFIFCPRKSGKTPLLSAILLYVLVCDGEIGAQVYSAAADKEQAALLFRHAAGMVRNNPELSAIINVYGGMTRRSLVYESHQSVYRALSSDAKTKHGLAPSLVVVDELHAMDDRELVDTLATGMASKNRKNPLLLYITTADYDRPSICNEKHAYASDVRDGKVVDPYFLPAIYEAERGDDWTDERIWEKANPNLDVSVSREYLRAECEKAKANPALENAFRRLHLNQKTSTDIRWMPLETWDDSSGLEFGETPEAWRARILEEKAGEPCVLGLDLSQRVDVTALSVLFPADKESGEWVVVPFFWVPADNVRKREKKDHVEYASWAARGFVTMTPGDWIDQDAVREKIEECCDRFDVREVAYDPWNADALGQALTNAGIPAVRVRQGMQTLSEPMKTFFGITLGGRMHHGGNPILRWMIGNTAAKTDVNGNIQPDKARSTERIDGVTATLTAMAAALKMDFSEGNWDYEKNGLPGL